MYIYITYDGSSNETTHVHAHAPVLFCSVLFYGSVVCARLTTAEEEARKERLRKHRERQRQDEEMSGWYRVSKVRDRERERGKRQRERERERRGGERDRERE